MSQSPFNKQKTDSNASIRPAKLDAIEEHAEPSNPTPTDALANRKRKSLSVSSARGSESTRQRPRIMVVTNYDGDMQKSFELLVRGIGTGRNLLRKAKMEARMNDMATMADSSDEEDDDADHGHRETTITRVNYKARMSALRARSAARRSGRLGVSSGETPAELFDSTDKTLEQAQELCEKAAHLTLREGDCRKELAAVRVSFDTLLVTATTQVDKYNARKLQDPPELQAHETSDTSMSSLEPDMAYRKDTPQAPLPLSDPNLKSAHPAGAAGSGPLKIVDLEVDDEGSDDDFVLPPVRLTSRLR